jgi:hypothetical protein
MVGNLQFSQEIKGKIGPHHTKQEEGYYPYQK